MTIALRDYQNECIDTVLNEFQSGINRQLISLPTGSGKTIIMSAIAKQINKKTLILAHREELIQQTVDKMRLFWPEVSIGVCMGERDEIHSQIVVGSVQSCSRSKRLNRLLDLGFELLLIDEAHHATADSYQNIIKATGFSNDSNKLLIGVTATASRSDKQSLGETFDKITFNRSISTMILAGYLSPVIGRKILTNLALDRIRTQNGDFAVRDLSEAVNTDQRNKFIVDKFKEYAEGRKGVAFCCDVKHSKDLAKLFTKEGIQAAAVWGDMPTDKRKKTLKKFKHGKIQVVTSCGILVEGYDEPSIDAIIMARPTKSSALYIQSVGRGLRLWPGKSNCLVLDFNDNEHNLESVMSLSCVVPESTVIKQENESDRKNEEIEKLDRVSKIECFDEVDKEFDILVSNCINSFTKNIP